MNIKQKFVFIVGFINYKLNVVRECRNFRLKVILNEIIWFIFRQKYVPLLTFSKNIIKLQTILGDFFIRDTQIDLLIASPAFERGDINELIKRIKQSLSSSKVLFIDIGANLGKYTISVGKTLYKYKKQLTILSFEPEPFLFSLLNKNIRLNNLVNCKSYNVALSSTKGRKKFYYYKPMQQIVSFPTDKQIYVKTNTLKDVLKIYPKNQEIFIKIDVEGHEKEVLQGVGNILKSFKKVTLLMEDSESVDSKKLLSYLSYNAHFLFKKTPYNSFWQIFPQSD